MDNIKDLIDTLRQIRSADRFKELFAEASLVVTILDIELAKPLLASRSVCRAAVGGTDQYVEQYFRINVLYPAIDSIVTDLELRFGGRKRRVVELARLIPAYILKNSEDNWLCGTSHLGL
ncbi:Zinc finger MYM-type protein 1-like [Oopsacas minuta]|uniref:Zinc finger MYM-type protein 1-like n=1 Tax=Oopsacas minuta TaxID=111878 RepID=A0AAV7K9P8_9METZ|nr:Zinc finger MYM-type protein 1-like [Oopsacas minuta]